MPTRELNAAQKTNDAEQRQNNIQTSPRFTSAPLADANSCQRLIVTRIAEMINEILLAAARFNQTTHKQGGKHLVRGFRRRVYTFLPGLS
jgi:hypothetical protein